MTKLEITRLLSMIADEDEDPDTFNFVLNRIFGAIEGRHASDTRAASGDVYYCGEITLEKKTR